MNPIVIAHHLIWTAYGTWLPNDPRGSGSATIRNDVLAEIGDLHFGRKKAQPSGKVVREFYENAAERLEHPILKFDETARAHIAEPFQRVIERDRFTCYACAIMPDHVHILIRKHKFEAEDMIDSFKIAARGALIGGGSWEETHPVWSSGHGWKVFLEHPDDVRRTILYIEKNPLPLTLPIQQWPFVIPYDGWPLHPGHSPNSPYAKRLRAVGRYP